MYQLKMSANSVIDVEDDRKKPIFDRWCDFWGTKLKRAEMIEMDKPNTNIGLILILVTVSLWLILTIIFKNPLLAVFPGAFILFVISALANKKIKARKKIMEDQIPSFLAALKSNVQANSNPERALIDAIETTTSPLYDELEIAKLFASTSSFSSALMRLREETSSKDIRFLCSCIELSSKLGANLETQIVVIEKMIEDKKEIQRKLEKAVAENRPLLYVASGILPLLFGITYALNEPTRDFWFKVPISWIVFFAIIGIFGTAVFITNKMIKKLDDLK